MTTITPVMQFFAGLLIILGGIFLTTENSYLAGIFLASGGGVLALSIILPKVIEEKMMHIITERKSQNVG